MRWLAAVSRDGTENRNMDLPLLTLEVIDVCIPPFGEKLDWYRLILKTARSHHLSAPTIFGWVCFTKETERKMVIIEILVDKVFNGRYLLQER
jgi:hypothetical protein